MRSLLMVFLSNSQAVSIHLNLGELRVSLHQRRPSALWEVTGGGGGGRGGKTLAEANDQ